MKAFAEKQGFEIIDVTAERASGLDLSRRGLAEVSSAVDAGGVDLLLVANLARFARNTVDCLKYIRALRELGIAVIFEKKDLLTAKVPEYCGISALFNRAWCLVGV